MDLEPNLGVALDFAKLCLANRQKPVYFRTTRFKLDCGLATGLHVSDNYRSYYRLILAPCARSFANKKGSFANKKESMNGGEKSATMAKRRVAYVPFRTKFWNWDTKIEPSQPQVAITSLRINKD